MKQGLFSKIEEYDKFPELIKLWNKWLQESIILSNTNCEIKEWEDLLNYSKKHLKEVAEFIFDKFENNLEVGWPEMALLDNCMDQPLIETKPGQYISPQNLDIQNAYKTKCGLICGRLTDQ